MGVSSFKRSLARLVRARLAAPPPSKAAIAYFKSTGERFTYADVGSNGGLPAPYIELSRAHLVDLVLFDPQEDWVSHEIYAGCQLRHIPVALASTPGRRTLYIAEKPGCSSLLKPNSEVLKRFPVAAWFRTVRQLDLDVTTYVAEQERLGLPTPDIVKLDVQGAELEVLTGFGHVFANVTFVEMETVMEPLYEGQPTLFQVREFMRERGFVLRSLVPQGPFEGEAIEFNSFWSRSPNTFSSRQHSIAKVWEATHGVWPGEFLEPCARL